jgi:putative membrane protein
VRRRAAYDSPMLERLALRWAFNVAALFVAAWLLSGVSYGDDWWALLIAAIVFTLVNAFIKPVLAILSIPFIVVTLGIFYFLLNILMLYITDWIVGPFEIKTFWWGALAALIVSIVNGILHMIFGDPSEFGRQRREPAY